MVEPLTGRRRIYSEYSGCDETNVIDILQKALPIHSANASEIRLLYRYYKGQQPILARQKPIRPEICNRIVENHAQECVNFKIGYQLSDPVQYISRAGENNDDASEQIKRLNDLMFAEDKASSDHDLFEWECICGVGYRLVLPDKAVIGAPDSANNDIGTAPFNMHVLEPMNTFIVYTGDYSHRPICGVYITYTPAKNRTYTVYTENQVFEIKENAIQKQEPHYLGNIPIVEYDLNNARMGVFEPCLSILDAINALESNRLDGIEQTVQSLMKFINCDISEEDFTGLLELGAIKVSSVDGQQGDVEILHNDLDQTQTQVTKEDLYQAFVNITGMPNRSQGSSSSDTGAAVLLRDGWTLAESHAKSYELQFKKAERQFLRLVLRVIESVAPDEKINLRIRDIDIAFNRRNYDNILTKSQVLTTMLGTDKVHPLLAFQACGLFTDPEAAYLMSSAYLDEMAANSALQRVSEVFPDDEQDPGEKQNTEETGQDKIQEMTPGAGQPEL